ncbi:uncharacterized protein LOC132269774 [Cornus florida]|uniref:uncharacterized protein LOC132269774 n=1 Tax=Cornus florida TaxID=4283 RepID=UPI00289B44E8|nr:uncharacterized protein LOC132269774 [Cornus florida]
MTSGSGKEPVSDSDPGFGLLHPRFKHHWRCKEQGITHLSFADHLLLVYHRDIESVSVLKSALDFFCSMSGLAINLTNSSIFLSGSGPHTEEAIIEILGIHKGNLPIRHLGVPLITTNLKAAECRPFIDNITHWIIHWSARSLSYAGPKMKSTGAKVAWKTVCKPKEEGSLGLPNLKFPTKLPS